MNILKIAAVAVLAAGLYLPASDTDARTRGYIYYGPGYHSYHPGYYYYPRYYRHSYPGYYRYRGYYPRHYYYRDRPRLGIYFRF